MLLNRLYYELKPLVPRPIRTAVRRRLVHRQQAISHKIWPIDERAGRTPVNWPGWPNGKKFAVVLTHDVEGHIGLQRCADIARLEESLGFCSSFNFIPEGPYRVPAAIRNSLTGAGFEVGVHDLRHDGKLFRTRKGFRTHAQAINRYLNEWGAVGFRSGFMLRHLDWIHDLEIEYDASTFDTDPFEPQPEGAGTIFPFLVSTAASHPKAQRPLDSTIQQFNDLTSGTPSDRCPLTSEAKAHSTIQRFNDSTQPDPALVNRKSHIVNGSPRSYVELPYTLPQDSTLFIYLQERSIDIWKRKLAWIAQRGGLVLLNTHPDYMAPDGARPGSPEFPIAFYREFLQHLKSEYAGAYHLSLPRDMARFCKTEARLQPVSRKRVCMVAYTSYESDNRVMRYAEALSARGDTVDILALQGKENLPKTDTINGVNLFRIQKRIGKNEKGKISYLSRLLRFTCGSSVRLAWRHLKSAYDVVHVHNIPDFLVFSAWAPRLSGAKVILDIHDVVPEFYANKFAENDSLLYKALLATERRSTRFADHVIISNHLWYEKLLGRSTTRARSSVFINHVDLRLFHQRPRTRKDDKLIMIFPGGLQWHQGVDVAIRAVAQLAPKLPKLEFHIYGQGGAKTSLIDLTQQLGLEQKVLFFDSVPIARVPELIADADIGVVPKRADSFGNEAYSTKILEFMSQGIPVVASRTKIDEYYFNEDIISFFDSGNVEQLAARVLELVGDPVLRKAKVAKALDFVRANNWQTRQTAYLQLVDTLCANGTPCAEPSPTKTIEQRSQAPEPLAAPLAK